ncbi:DUF421 domain-containing protein [Alteromonas sp. ASW11-19]|uniref:DUF421 domain-containing protein n=1 Tax=Alteromonas salexigens TaxID=2982530 RepID=A0ABT2VPY4_9ALTE|nr:YetF domain-containing protein [Alteromonas salexigens]MCU7555382.1 DUF421 domain-containing protein [Alteromonas salexigens]
MFVDSATLDLIIRSFLLAALAICWVVILVRINGLRSFSKMTNFDFVMTIAMGSLLAGASQSTSWSAFFQSGLAMATLFLVQYSTANIRQSSDRFESWMQNAPVILMRDGVILEAALKETRVAKSDLIAKLREANVLEFSKVRAVILETTGDISVLHGSDCNEELLQGTCHIKSAE